MDWSIRDLLNPVITRTLLYGTSDFDLEYVLRKVENIDKLSGKAIHSVWINEWKEKAEKYRSFAIEAAEAGHGLSSYSYYMMAAQCYYSCYMINSDDINEKLTVYKLLEANYALASQHDNFKAEAVMIPLDDGRKLPAYIHYPDSNGDRKYPCALIFAGLGSCKEELDILSKPLLERGLSTLTCDMAGTGSALFEYNVQCNGDDLKASFEALNRFSTNHPHLDPDRLASYGLCMGGGYAIKYASLFSHIKCCACLFPFFMSLSEMDSIPIWMKKGKWPKYQFGIDRYPEPEAYLNSMEFLNPDKFTADFLMVHSDDDNWISPQTIDHIFNLAAGSRKRIKIEEKPAYISTETIMHAMPVGEQFHWVKHIVSDWMAEHLEVE